MWITLNRLVKRKCFKKGSENYFLLALPSSKKLGLYPRNHQIGWDPPPNLLFSFSTIDYCSADNGSFFLVPSGCLVGNAQQRRVRLFVSRMLFRGPAPRGNPPYMLSGFIKKALGDQASRVQGCWKQAIKASPFRAPFWKKELPWICDYHMF